jgi:hypothetical protein
MALPGPMRAARRTLGDGVQAGSGSDAVSTILRSEVNGCLKLGTAKRALSVGYWVDPVQSDFRPFR